MDSNYDEGARPEADSIESVALQASGKNRKHHCTSETTVSLTMIAIIIV